MFAAGSPAKWMALKPFMQGLGATTTTDGVTLDVLFVNGTSRSRFVTLNLFMYANDKPYTVTVKNPNLAPGVHTKVVLDGKR